MKRKPFLIGILSAVLMASAMFSAALAQTATPSPISPTATATDAETQAAALANQGDTLNNAGNYTEAAAAYSQAIALMPDVPELYMVRASIYSKLGEYDKVVSDLSQVIT